MNTLTEEIKTEAQKLEEEAKKLEAKVESLAFPEHPVDPVAP